MAGEEDTIVEVTPELEAQAREMGWRPKEEFKGDEGKWVDAKTFVERGEHVLPIIKETNQRLRNDLSRTHSKVTELENALRASQETIAALERYHQDDVKQKVERARKELKAQLVSAKKEGDIETEVEITEELARLNTAVDTASDNPPKKETPKALPSKDYTQEPEFIAWKQDNPWVETDPYRMAIASQVTVELRRSGDTSTGRIFLDKVSAGVNREVTRLAGRPTPPKVEGGKGGAGGGTGGGSNGKSYADLPADAKAACDDFAKDLVGPNRKYATTADWHKAYVSQYFAKV